LSASLGLTGIALPDLKELLSLIEQGRLSCPLNRAALMAHGLGQVAEALPAALSLDGSALEVILRVAIGERELRPGPRLELVWTGPEAHVSHARDTAVVVRQLFEQARRSVLIAGFCFDHGEDIFRPLHAAMKDRGVEAQVFLDIEGEAASGRGVAVFADEAVRRFLASNWPFGEPYPQVFYDPRTAAPGAFVSLHAKCIIVDEAQTLVTSANFTDRGQTRNIEVGVLIEDPSFAARLAAQWLSLVDIGLMVRGAG